MKAKGLPELLWKDSHPLWTVPLKVTVLQIIKKGGVSGIYFYVVAFGSNIDILPSKWNLQFLIVPENFKLTTITITKHRIQWTQNSIFLIKNQSEGLGTWPNGWSACCNSLEHWVWILCANVKSSVIAHPLNPSERVQGQGNPQGSLVALSRLVSEHKVENDVVRRRPLNSNSASICTYAHECICTHMHLHT